MGVLGGIGLVVCAVAVWWTTAAAARGRLARNATFGIRTSVTRTNDEAWLAGHRGALPTTRIVGVVSLVLGAALVAAGLWHGGNEPSTPITVLFTLGYGVLLVGSVVAAWKANSAGEQALPPEERPFG